jgi:predicted ArsR family transcriptional regulator
MSIAIVPTIQTRARALKQMHPEMTEQEIARKLHVETNAVRQALQAKQRLRKKFGERY